MLPKPASCVGCPMYGDGKGFVPDKIVKDSPITILAHAPGEDEERGRKITGYTSASGRSQALYEACDPQPLTGKTGYEWERTYLPGTGLDREQVSLCHIIKCRGSVNGKRTNDLPEGAAYEGAVKHCTRAHLRIPDGTRLIVAMGQDTWAHSQGQGYPLHEWRGYVGPHQYAGRPVMGVLHVGDLFREPRMKGVSKSDWRRVAKYLRGEWPHRIPSRLVVSHDGEVGAAVSAIESALANGSRFAIDTEYQYDDKAIPGTGALDMVGLGWRQSDLALTGVQVDWTSRDLSRQAKDDLTAILKRVAYETITLFQNAAADIPILEHNLGIVRGRYKRFEDLLLAHAVLWCELPHDLGFLASVLGNYAKLKHLMHTDPLLYNWGDVVETLVAFEKVEKELRNDAGSRTVYEQLLKLVVPHTEATETGIAIDKDAVLPALLAYMEKQTEALKMARAYAGYPINMGSNEQLTRYLYTHLGLATQVAKKSKRPTIDDDAIASLRKIVGPAFDAEEEERNGLTVGMALERIEEGANPVLEGRVIFAKAGQVISHYLVPLVKGVE